MVSNDRLMLLKKIGKLEEISPSDLYKDNDTVNETFGSKRTVQRALKELCNEEGFLKREKDGKRWLYKLTEQGKNHLHKVKKRERQKKQSQQDMFDYDTGFEEFVNFFEEEKYGLEQIQKASIGRNYAYLDYQDLEKFNHELADDLLSDPDNVLSAAKEAVQSLPDVKDDIDVRIKNISDIESQGINELSSRDRNKLVTVEGVIQSVSRPGSKVVSAIFECRACGERYEKDQDGTDIKSPYKCECGNRRFDKIRENHRTIRYVNICEKPDQRSRESIIAVIEGELAEDKSKSLKAIGSGVKITGYLDTYLKNKNDGFHSFRLIANNIEIEESKWDIEELASEREKEIKQLSNRDDIEKKLTESLAYDEIKGLELLKESFIVYLLGKTREFGNVHFLCIGDPGTAKSHLAKYVSQHSNRVIKSVATGATQVGLTAAVVKDEMTGQYTAEAGALPMADGGFHITDEVDELKDEHYSAFNEALSDESISLSKANIQAELSADVSEFAIGNPSPHYSFDDHTPKIEQVPIKKDDLISRFGIMLAVEDDDDVESKLEKAEHMLNRSRPGEIQLEDRIEPELLFDYIHFAQRIDPRLTDDAFEKIKEALRGLFEESSMDRIKLRHAEALAGVSCAYARMNLSEEVYPRHVDSAFSFFRRCYSSIGFDIGKDDFSDVDGMNTNRLKTIKEKIEELSSDQEAAEVQEVIEDLEMSEEIVEDTIEKLEKEGELIDSGQGEVKAL